MENSLRWPVYAAIVAVVGAAVYFFSPTSPPPPAPAVVTLQAPVAAPRTHYAIESPAAGQTPLPSLDASDRAIGDALAQCFGISSLPEYFYPDRMVRRFVATIDNLPRRQAPAALMPIKPVAGAFAVAGTGDHISIAPANAARYLPYVEFVQRADVAKLADVYIRFYPLFQQAYQELGYPKGYFNDRLIEAIDDLLDAPEPPTPVPLAQPKVLYVFSDAEIETSSAGQKMMIRLGHANAVRVKAVLRALRGELLRRGSGAVSGK